MARQRVKKRFFVIITILILVILVSHFYPSGQQPIEQFRQRQKDKPRSHDHSDFLISTPNNARYPLHLVRIRSDDSLQVKRIQSVDNKTTSATPLFLTNLDSTVDDKHTPTIIVATNERKDGELVRIDLDPTPDSDRAIISLVGRTSGDDPAFTRVLQRGQHRVVMTVNYGSPILSIHDVSNLRPNPPSFHRFHESPGETSHPHQIILHPHLHDIIYIPDLGTNTIRVVRLLQDEGDELDKVIDMQQLPVDKSTCVGPRHGVFTLDGHTLIIACQTSNTIVQIPVARSGYLTSDKSLPYSSTLSTTAKTPAHHALSAISISTSGEYIFVANRQVQGIYSHPVKDTIVVYRIAPRDNNLRRLGWVDLDCWQPREMLLFPTKTRSHRLLVTCVGRGGAIEHAGAGIRLIDVEITADEVKSNIVGRWDDESAWGVASLSVE